MKKHIFIMIRYSVLSSDNSAWVIGREHDFEGYKASLFSKERMELHEELFFNVTLPSLQAMNRDNTTILIFTSEDLPAINMEKLASLQKNSVNVKVIPLPMEGKLIHKMDSCLLDELKGFNDSVCYATVRVDDDDALSNTFEKELTKYVQPAFSGHVVSFSRGYDGVYQNGNYIAFTKRDRAKSAVGLSFVQTYKPDREPKKASIYSLGSHTKVDAKNPIIINPLRPMYIRTVHAASDIYYRKFSKKLDDIVGVDSIDTNVIQQRFSLDPKVL